jgi:hypothetical protein
MLACFACAAAAGLCTCPRATVRAPCSPRFAVRVRQRLWFESGRSCAQGLIHALALESLILGAVMCVGTLLLAAVLRHPCLAVLSTAVALLVCVGAGGREALVADRFIPS